MQQIEIDFKYDVKSYPSTLAFIAIKKGSAYNYIMVNENSTKVFDETMKVTQNLGSLGVVAVAD